MQLFSTFALLAASLTAVSAGSHSAHRRHAEVAKRATGDLSRRATNSKWSYYDTETGNAGSCGTYLKNSDFVVAMNVAQMNPGMCFQQITMSYGGKTTQATIVDTCPGCPYEGLDLSPALFAFFADHGKGIIYGDWNFGGGAPAPAPAPEPAPAPAPEPAPEPAPAPVVAPIIEQIVPAPSPTSTPPAPTSSEAPPPPPPSSSAAPPSSSPAANTPVPSAQRAQTSPASEPSAAPAQDGNIANVCRMFIEMGSLAAAGAGSAPQ